MTLSRYDEIRARIEDFVTELDQLVRQAALQSVQEALGSQSAAGVVVDPKALAKAIPGARAAKSAVGPRAVAQTGGKRTAKQLEALTDGLLKFIEKHPGSRMEQISEGMGLASKELTLPLRNLKAEGHLKTKGQKRATAYYAK